MYQFEAALGQQNWYRGVFDPFEAAGDVLEFSLGDDLADIYVWLKDGLLRMGHGSRAMLNAAYALRFDFETHAGQHLTNASRAIYFIRRRDEQALAGQ